MCKCTPEIRTPFCGKVGCEWPPVDKWEIVLSADTKVEKLERNGVNVIKWLSSINISQLAPREPPKLDLTYIMAHLADLTIYDPEVRVTLQCSFCGWSGSKEGDDWNKYREQARKQIKDYLINHPKEAAWLFQLAKDTLP